MMKNFSTVSVLILFAALAFAEIRGCQCRKIGEMSSELCEMQIELNEVIERLTPKGQTTVRNLFLDFQNEFSSVIKNIYANIKSNNADVLAKLNATEGNNLAEFWNVIGFNNETVSNKQQLVDLCQLKTNLNSSFDKLSPTSRKTIGQLFSSHAKDFQAGFQQTVQNFEPKAKEAANELLKNENVLDLLILKNLLQSFPERLNAFDGKI